MVEKDATSNDDLMKEFAEFLEAKRASEKEATEQEDFDVEIWDEKGRGVRTKRSHAKPFLNTLGLDVDAPANDGTSDDGDKDKSSTKTSRKTSAKGPDSSVRKYFTNKK